MKQVTLAVDATVLTSNAEQEGAVRGYNPNPHGRAGHHPLLAFVSEARMVANFWLRPGNAHSANNILQFLESTLHHRGEKGVGLLRPDRGFFDEAILTALEGKRIPYIVAARLVGAGDRAGTDRAALPGHRLENRAAPDRGAAEGLRNTAPGKTLSLFADDPDIQGWRYGAFVSSRDLPMLEVWRTYRGRADCENRIKELQADFGLDAFNMRDFWAMGAALGFAMHAYNLMSLFRQAVLRSRIQHTLSTWHGLVLAIGGSWH